MSELDVLLKLRQIERELNELRRQMASGDMLKSVYDANNNGIVDAAESVPWAGVTGKPEYVDIDLTAPKTIGTHTYERSTDFPGVPAGVKAVYLVVLGRWSAVASATTRTSILGWGGLYGILTNVMTWAYASFCGRVVLNQPDESFEIKIEGADMEGLTVTIRGYEM